MLALFALGRDLVADCKTHLTDDFTQPHAVQDTALVEQELASTSKDDTNTNFLGILNTQVTI
jgi:hypothetical protein